MSDQLPAACAACDEHLVSLAFDEPESVPAECVAHASTCAGCAARLASLRDTLQLAALPMEEPSDALDARILAAFDEHLTQTQAAPPRTPALTVLPGGATTTTEAPRPAARGWRAPLAAAASVAVLVGGVLMMSEGTRLARQGAPGAEKANIGPAPSVPPPAVADKQQEAPLLADVATPAPAPADVGDPAPSRNIASKDRVERRAKALKEEARREYAPPTSLEKKKAEAPAPKPAAPMAAKGSQAPEEARLQQKAPAPAPEVQAEAAALAADSFEFDALETEGLGAGAPPSFPQALSGSAGARSGSSARLDSVARLDHPRLLSQADAAFGRGDHRLAASLYGQVANDDEAPTRLVVRALEGQAKSLLSLRRYAEAAAAAHRLSVLSPGATRLGAEIEAARLSDESAPAGK